MKSSHKLFLIVFALIALASGFLYSPRPVTRVYAQGAPCTNTPNVGFYLPNIGNVTNWGLCVNADINSLDALLGGSATLGNNSTPSVTGFTNWLTANSGPVTITNFLSGFSGQTIRILCSTGDSTTNINSTANISVLSNWNCAASSTISLTLIGSVWREVSRATGNISGVALLGSPNTFTSANTFNTTVRVLGLTEFDSGISADGIHPELIPVNSSTLVDLTAVQTMLNKTLTSPTVTGGTFGSSTLNTPTVNGATFTGTLSFAGASGGLGPLTAGTGILGAANAWTAAQTFSAAANLNAGGAFVGTFSGTHTESGATTFSGAVTFSGSGTTGNLTAGNGLLATANNWSAVQTFASPVINNGSLNGTVANNGTVSGGSYNSPTLNGPGVNNGIYAAGSGFEHTRFTTCMVASISCSDTVGWPGAFADTNYTMVCTAIDSGGFGDILEVSGKGTTNFSYTMVATNGGFSFAVEADCYGVHD